MPKNAQALFRQWHLLRAIPRYPRKIAIRELRSQLVADGFSISERSIQRDLIDLSRLFPLQCDDREKPYGWSWSAEAPILDIPGLGMPEAMALILAEQFLLPLIPGSMAAKIKPFFLAANQRIRKESKAPSRRAWSEKVRSIPPTQPLIAPQVDVVIHDVITMALLEEHPLSIDYQARGNSQPNEYQIHPLGLVQRGPVQYLLGLLGGKGKPKMFAMHRIHRAEALPGTSVTPKGFSIDHLIQDGMWGFGSGRMISLEVVFQPGYGDHLQETVLTEDQFIEELPGGLVRLCAKVPDSQQLCWWLLGFGSGVEVIKPDHYRQWFRETAKEMTMRYE